MILDDLAAATRARVARKKREVSFKQVKQSAEKIAAGEGAFTFPFEKAISKKEISFICEVKRRHRQRELSLKNFHI